MSTNTIKETNGRDSTSITNGNPPKKVKFNRNGLAVGPNATQFQSSIGDLVRTYVPIKYAKWKSVPKNYKDDIWKNLLKKYEVPYYVKKSIQKTMPGMWRRHKNTLRKKYLDVKSTLDAQQKNIPPGVKKEDWEEFCCNENDENQKKLRKTNSLNKKKSVCGHTGGRNSAAMVEDIMIENQEDPAIPITRTQVWIETHTRKDKSILPSAVERMELVKKMIEEAKTSGDSNVHSLSIDDDPLTRALGKKTKGLPGVGSCVSKTEYEASLPSHMLHLHDRAEKLDLAAKYDILVAKHEKLESKLDYAISLFLRNNSKGDAVVESTPSVPFIMNSQNKHHLVNESNTASSAQSEPAAIAKYYELLNWEGKCVAIAKEVVDPIHRNICHGYTLEAHEMKVSMVTRKILDAELYKAEKNPESNTIGEVGVGDFIVWPKSSVRLH